MADGSDEQPKQRSSLMTHQAVLKQIEECKAIGSKINWNKDAGTLAILFDDEIIVRALQKGSGDANWIVTFYTTGIVSWSHTDG